MSFFADEQCVRLFERYMFWKRTENANTEFSSKWAYDKYKHEGKDNGTVVQSATRPEICLMRDSDPSTNASGQALLEDIYVEKRKELLCEGVTGFYDLVRLQKDLVRIGVTASNPAGHYEWGMQYLNGYSFSDAQPQGYLKSYDYPFFCQIPQTEMNNNDSISSNEQNPWEGQ